MYMISDILSAQMALGMAHNLAFDEPMNITEEQLLPQVGDADCASILAYISEQPMRDLRAKRNALLAETDWWASSDLTMTAEQVAYRQALRDITQSYTSLDDVVWPVKP